MPAAGGPAALMDGMVPAPREAAYEKVLCPGADIYFKIEAGFM